MTSASRHYQERHGGAPAPLVALHRYLCEHGRIAHDAVGPLSEALGLPPAAVRGAASSYERLGTREVIDVCHGTSCFLRGGRDAEHRLAAARVPTRSLYCLGYCDRSPTALRPDGSVIVRTNELPLPAITSEPASSLDPPLLRSISRETIVLRNLLAGGCASLEEARSRGVWGALECALRIAPDDLIRRIVESGELGRGGAAYPTGRKWEICARSPGSPKYVIANGDEGDPGSYIDRLLMEGDPHSVLEGLAICARAVGANEGTVFIRSEYPVALARMEQAVDDARAAGVLGDSVLGSGWRFDVTVFPGFGSYVSGEETALLEALEGGRGEVRLRPPYPAEAGLHGKPTVIDNVETLVNVPWIITNGAAAYRRFGTPGCSGTKAICLDGGFERPGVVEVEFGVSLRDVLDGQGGHGAGGEKLAAVLLGGPMGSLLTRENWDVPICYIAMGERGIRLGHGGVIAVPEGTDCGDLLCHLLEFMQRESCGRCVPCRVGSKRALEMARRLVEGRREKTELRDDGSLVTILRELLEIVEDTSLCAFGQLAPGPLKTLLERLLEGAGDSRRDEVDRDLV